MKTKGKAPSGSIQPPSDRSRHRRSVYRCGDRRPGTGKTKTLVGRIAYLLEQRGVSPKEITAVTLPTAPPQKCGNGWPNDWAEKISSGNGHWHLSSHLSRFIAEKALDPRWRTQDLLKEIGANWGLKHPPVSWRMPFPATKTEWSFRNNGLAAPIMGTVSATP